MYTHTHTHTHRENRSDTVDGQRLVHVNYISIFLEATCASRVVVTPDSLCDEVP